MARTMATTAVIVLLPLLVLPALAGPPAKEEFIQQLMKLSGLDAQVRQLPLQGLASFGEQNSQLPAELYDLTARAVGAALDDERLLKTVSKQVESNLDTVTRQADLTRHDWGP